MEDILSSIRRVIAREDSRDALTEAHEAARPAPRAPAWDEDVAPVTQAQMTPPVADPVTDESDILELGVDDAADAASGSPSEPLVSDASADAARHALSSLTEAMADATAPVAVSGGKTSVDDLVLEALRPMLREWLDAHLPPMVERMVAQEIARISGRRV